MRLKFRNVVYWNLLAELSLIGKGYDNTAPWAEFMTIAYLGVYTRDFLIKVINNLVLRGSWL
jgi:hypothetical protein